MSSANVVQGRVLLLAEHIPTFRRITFWRNTKHRESKNRSNLQLNCSGRDRVSHNAPNWGEWGFLSLNGQEMDICGWERWHTSQSFLPSHWRYNWRHSFSTTCLWRGLLAVQSTKNNLHFNSDDKLCNFMIRHALIQVPKSKVKSVSSLSIYIFILDSFVTYMLPFRCILIIWKDGKSFALQRSKIWM